MEKLLTTLIIGCNNKCREDAMRQMAHFNKDAVVNVTEKQIVVNGCRFIFLTAHNCIEKIMGLKYNEWVMCDHGDYEPLLKQHLMAGKVYREKL